MTAILNSAPKIIIPKSETNIGLTTKNISPFLILGNTAIAPNTPNRINNRLNNLNEYPVMIFKILT
jgi:hypothetical protein